MGAFGRDLIRHFGEESPNDSEQAKRGGDLDAYDGNKKHHSLTAHSVSERPLDTNCKKQFKVIIAGSRNFKDYNYLKEKCDYVLQNIKDEIVIVSGKASGADSLGEKYAKEKGYDILEFPADWNDTYNKPRTEISFKGNRPYWTKAGLYRNGLMAEEADALIAFSVGNSRGTANMIKQAKDKGLKVKVYEYENI